MADHNAAQSTQDPDESVPGVDPATIAADEATADVGPVADRAPTVDEERIADDLAEDVPSGVGDHARKMASLGAKVRGEGEIVPGR